VNQHLHWYLHLIEWCLLVAMLNQLNHINGRQQRTFCCSQCVPIEFPPIKFPKCFPSSQCVPQDASNCTAVVSYGKTWKTNKLEFFIFYVTDPGKAQNNKPRQSSLGGGYHLPQDINMESKTGHLSGAFVFYIGVTKLALW
jgi:hypothetical protein